MRVAIQQFEHDRCTRPSHWTPSNPVNDAGAGVLTLVQLEDSNVLGCLQEHLFGNYIGYGGRDQKLSGTYSRLELKVAWRVENADLLNKYKAEQRKVHSFVASHNVPLGGKSKAIIRPELHASSKKLPWTTDEVCNEVRLLHGTSPEVVLSILQHGMNERFAGASAGTKFGNGTYFADDAGKIDQYCQEDNQYDNTGALSSLHKRIYKNSQDHPGQVFYALVFRVSLGYSVHYADDEEECFNPNANRRELCNIPNTDPPTPYHSLVAEGERVKLRFNEYVVFHRLLPSSSNDDDDTSHFSS